MSVTANPMTWNDLQDINEVHDLDAEDSECLGQLGIVLKRFQKTDRFGICLLHQHFPLKESELLVEHVDVEARVLTTSPVNANAVMKGNYLPTVWRIDGEAAKACSYCPTTTDGKKKRHVGYKDSH